MIPDIATALAARLGEWADAEGIPVAWENVPFTPPSDGLYLAVHDMPATPRTVDLGLRCRIYSGVYQINVVAPAGTGRIQTQLCCTSSLIPASSMALFHKLPVNHVVVSSAYRILTTPKPAPIAVRGLGHLNGPGPITLHGFSTTWWLATVSDLGIVLQRPT